ncbi:MAG: response regulator [Spirochaetales bacterium]|nr:response regulator [Spirochaetales bacterium]
MKKTILVVDDDVDVIESRKIILEHNNYNVLTATTIDVAWELINENAVDLILLDVMMNKDTDGFFFAQKLKADSSFKDIPIILITAVNQRTKFRFDIEEDEDYLPVDKFLEKPVDPDDLIMTIRGLFK